MNIPSFKKVMASAMAAALVHAYAALPVQAMLAPANEAISGQKGAEGLENRREVEAFLQRKIVRQKLADLGMSEREISQRLSRLSDEQMKQIAMHIEREMPAGDGAAGVLVVIVLALLIVYLIQRI